MCWMTSHLWWFLKIKSYDNIQSSRILFGWICKLWVTHTHKKTGNKLERSLVPFHIRSQMTQMHRCYSKCVCVLRERHCSWPRLNRPRLPNYSPDSWFRVSSLTIILLGIWSWFYYSFGFLFCLNSLVNLVLYTFRMTEFKALSLVFRCRPLLRFSLLTAYVIFITIDHLCLNGEGFYVFSGKCWAKNS